MDYIVQNVGTALAFRHPHDPVTWKLVPQRLEQIDLGLIAQLVGPALF
jgi:hypothetical protein